MKIKRLAKNHENLVHWIERFFLSRYFFLLTFPLSLDFFLFSRCIVGAYRDWKLSNEKILMIIVELLWTLHTITSGDLHWFCWIPPFKSPSLVSLNFKLNFENFHWKFTPENFWPKPIRLIEWRHMNFGLTWKFTNFSFHLVNFWAHSEQESQVCWIIENFHDCYHIECIYSTDTQ